MGFFRNSSVQAKLLAAFIVVSLFGVGATGWNIYSVIQLGLNIEKLGQENENLVDLEEIQTNLLEQELAAQEYLLTGDGRYLSVHDGFSHFTSIYVRRATLASASDEEADRLYALQEGLDAYQQYYQKMLNAYHRGDVTEAVRITSETIERELDLIHNEVEDAMSAGRKVIRLIIEDADKLTRTTILSGVLILGVFAALALLISLATHQVVDPVLRLTNAVVAFENNSYRSDMLDEVAQRGDELGHLAKAFDRMVFSINDTLRSKDKLLTASNRFVPYEYLDFLQRDNIEEIKLGDHVSAEMAVMFSDIRSFTTISEQMTPQENFDFVNHYLSQVSPIIRNEQGFVVKFLGDGMMAIFPYGVDYAVRAGINKIGQVRKLNIERHQRGQAPIEVGIGIHTGHMMVGMIGEHNRMQGDAFSDNVNLTSRIEGLTKYYAASLIISEETYLRLEEPGSYLIRFLGRVQVKGRKRPIGLYEVYDADPGEIRDLKRKTQPEFDQAVKLYIAGKFPEAWDKFARILQVNPQDQTTRTYLARVEMHIDEGHNANWDGVEVMTSK